MHSEFHKPNHAFPHRIVLRQGKRFFRMVDIQMVEEHDSGLSVYVKPPSEYVYETRKPDTKIALPRDGGKHEINLNNDVTKGKTYFNPYMSWHGSGRLHSNAYSTKDLKSEILLNDSEAVSLCDIAVPPHILFTVMLPTTTLSYAESSPPPSDFNGNYIELSTKPSKRNELEQNGTLHLVIDQQMLKPGTVIMDVMVHNGGVNMDIEKNHPYPDGGEMLFVAPPVKIRLNNPVVPAVSLFFYQPVSPAIVTLEKQPVSFWGRSKGALTDQMFQTNLLG